MIRRIEKKDIKQILDIYNYYVLNSLATLEITPLSEKLYEERVERILNKYDFIVLEENDKVLGFAYLDAFNFREAYSISCDLSIYVHKGYLSKGYGKLLYDEIEKIAKDKGFINIISLVTDKNEGSIKFHLNQGFKNVGYLPNVAYKFDTWCGLKYYQKIIVENDKNLE